MKPSNTTNSPFQAVWPLNVPFFLFGLMLSTWSTRLPDIVETLHLTTEALSGLLFTRGLSQVIFFPVATFLLITIGSKKSSLYSGIIIFSTFPLYGILSFNISLGILFFLTGILFSTFDLANNSIGAEMERETKRKIMTSMHAWFSIGTVSGALLGTQAIVLGWSPVIHFSIISGISGITFIVANRFVPDSHTAVKTQPVHWKNYLNPGILVLGAALFCTATIESSLGSWTPLYFKESLASEPHQAIWGYTAFNATMLTGRIAGDFLRSRINDIPLAIGAATLGLAGFASTVFADSLLIATIGLGCAGLGMSVMFPIILGQAAPAGAGALASVATFGYFGGLVSPLLIGAAVSGHGFIAALYVFVIAAAILPLTLVAFFFIRKHSSAA